MSDARQSGDAREVAGAAAQPFQLALSVDAAAQALSVSRRHFDRHIKKHVRVVPSGSRNLVPVRELERYLDERAA
jgi:transcriptional regulator GlxA family with amidase domain